MSTLGNRFNTVTCAWPFAPFISPQSRAHLSLGSVCLVAQRRIGLATRLGWVGLLATGLRWVGLAPIVWWIRLVARLRGVGLASLRGGGLLAAGVGGVGLAWLCGARLAVGLRGVGVAGVQGVQIVGLARRREVLALFGGPTIRTRVGIGVGGLAWL